MQCSRNVGIRLPKFALDFSSLVDGAKALARNVSVRIPTHTGSYSRIHGHTAEKTLKALSFMGTPKIFLKLYINNITKSFQRVTSFERGPLTTLDTILMPGANEPEMYYSERNVSEIPIGTTRHNG